MKSSDVVARTALTAVLTAAAVVAVYLAVFENPEQYPEDV